jgi:hypothetical protein
MRGCTPMGSSNLDDWVRGCNENYPHVNTINFRCKK